jgi:putative methyltransferase (TIGR04325 family)
LYYKKVISEVKGFKKNNFITKFKNLWNEYSKDISKSGYLEKFNFTINSLYKEKDEIVIFDIGGGYGDNFYKFSRFNESKLKKIKYYIIDQDKKLLEIGKRFFAGRDNILFSQKLPNVKTSIVLMVGTLQFIDDFSKIISLINFEQLSYIYLSRTIFNDSNYDFYSKQKILGERDIEQSIKIHSLKKFINFMKKNGFEDSYVKKNQILNSFFDKFKSSQKVNYYDLLLKKKIKTL